jgi:hypothetical protein
MTISSTTTDMMMGIAPSHWRMGASFGESELDAGSEGIEVFPDWHRNNEVALWQRDDQDMEPDGSAPC